MRHFKSLTFFGVYLILAGLAGYLSNPEKAKTALMSGSVFGILSLIAAYLAYLGNAWGRRMGLGMCALLSVVFGWRSIVSWTAVAGGQTEKIFAASLISSMLVAALITLVILFKPKNTLA